jgi:hypothetical protein
MTMIARELNDSLDDIFGAPSGDVRTEPVRAPEGYKQPDYSEPCAKCRGTGRFVGRSGRAIGKCFTCKGEGKVMFKTSPETRAKQRAAEAQKKVNKVEAFAAAEPAVYAWLVESAPNFWFAASLLEKLGQYGDLTVGQLEACKGGIAKRDAARIVRAERDAAAPVLDLGELSAAFAKASKSLKAPKLIVGNIRFSLAKADSVNAGAIYVKSNGIYVGKVSGSKFKSSFACTPAIEAEVLEALQDPKGKAIAHGRLTGNCAICNRTLTDKDSVARGIGPICAENMGW